MQCKEVAQPFHTQSQSANPNGSMLEASEYSLTGGNQTIYVVYVVQGAPSCETQGIRDLWEHCVTFQLTSDGTLLECPPRHTSSPAQKNIYVFNSLPLFFLQEGP